MSNPLSPDLLAGATDPTEHITSTVKSIMLSGIQKAYLGKPGKPWRGHYFTPPSSITFKVRHESGLHLNLWLDSDEQRAKVAGTTANVVSASLYTDALSIDEIKHSNGGWLHSVSMFVQADGGATIHNAWGNRLPDAEERPGAYVSYISVLGSLGMRDAVPLIEANESASQAIDHESVERFAIFLDSYVIPVLQASSAPIRAALRA